MTEAEMRDAEVPTFKTPEEVATYIASLTSQPHDYGTCVYAMSMAATAAFNHVATKLGVTGFQASCADLDILRRTRHIDGPFMIVQLADCLYPQYDILKRVQDSITDNAQWLADEARKNLAEDLEHVHPNVLAHWQKLADTTPPLAVN